MVALLVALFLASSDAHSLRATGEETQFTGIAVGSISWPTSMQAIADVQDVYTRGLAVADVDKNGFDDIATLGFVTLCGQVKRHRVTLLSLLAPHRAVDVTQSCRPGGLPQLQGGAVSFEDFDSDSWQDIFLFGNLVSGSQGTYLFRNLANGSMLFSETNYFDGLPVADAVFADFFARGRIDAAFSTIFTAQFFMASQLNNLSYVKIAVNPAPDITPAVWFPFFLVRDFDSDGRLDFVLSGLAYETISLQVSAVYLMRGLPNNTFAALPTTDLPKVHSVSSTWIDMNFDGRQDLLIAGNYGGAYFSKNYSTYALDVLPNATFVLHPEWVPNELILGLMSDGFLSAVDLTSDGCLDLIALGALGQIALLSQCNGSWIDGSATWIPNKVAPNSLAKYPLTGALGNMNGDSLSDVIYIGINGFPSSFDVYERDASSKFLQSVGDLLIESLAPVRQFVVGSVSTLDYNLDGCADLVVNGRMNRDRAPAFFTMMYGNCNGSFLEASTGTISPFAGYQVWRDIDLDGRPDMFMHGALGGFGPVASIVFGSDVPYELPLPILPASWVMRGDVGFVDADSYPDIVNCGLYGVSLTCFVYIYGMNRTFVNDNLSAMERFGGFPDVAGIVVDFFDANADNSEDLLVYGKNGPILDSSFYMRRSNATFQRLSLPAVFGIAAIQLYNLDGISTGDLNGDGISDVLLMYSHLSGMFNHIYLGNGNGTYSPFNDSYIFGASFEVDEPEGALFDIDNNGYIDIILSGTSASAAFISIHLNNGGMNFSAFDIGRLPVWLRSGVTDASYAFADFNNDSLVDMALLGSMPVCGSTVVVIQQSPPVPAATTSTSGDVSLQTVSSNDLPLSLGALLGIIIGGASGIGLLMLAALAIVFLCCIVCCLCIVIVAVALLLIVAVIFFIVAAVVGGGGAAASVSFFARGSNNGAGAKVHKDDAAWLDIAIRAEDFDVTDFMDSFNAVQSFKKIPYSDLEIKSKIGEGGFGAVYRADWFGSDVALKLLRSESLDQSLVDEFQREALLMAKVSHHPNIVGFIGAVMSADRVGIVLEFCPLGSLDEQLRSSKISLVQKLHIALGVLSGLAFLHLNGIIHRDLAARNILLHNGMRPVICDFGLSRICDADSGNDAGVTKSNVGPVRWMAPEALTARMYSAATDLYSFGVLLWEIFTDGKTPFGTLSVVEVIMFVSRQGGRPDLDAVSYAPIIPILKSLWMTDPNQRPTIADLRTQLRELVVAEEEDSPIRAEAETTSSSEPSVTYSSMASESTDHSYQSIDTQWAL